MSLQTLRSDIVNALTAIDGLYPQESVPNTYTAGASWVQLKAIEPGLGHAKSVTWELSIVLESNTNTALETIESLYHEVEDAIRAFAYVDSAEPIMVAVSDTLPYRYFPSH